MSRQNAVYGLLLGVVVAVVACLHMPLMAAYRSNWLSRFPTYASHWPNNGPFTLLGYYGVDNADEVHYAAKVQEYARRFTARDPYVDKQESGLGLDYLCYRFLGALHRLTGDMNLTWLVARVLFCWLWFVLVYFIAMRLSPDPALAAFCAAFVCCFSHVLSLQFLAALRWSGGLVDTALRAAWNVLSYGRTEGVWRLPRPGMTVAGLFAATWVWSRALGSRGWGWWIAAGAAGGLLAHVRIEVWSALLVASCIFPVLSAFFERRWDWRWAVPPVLTVLISLPILGFALAPPEEFALKAGVAHLKRPDLQSLLYLPAILWILLRRRREPFFLFIASLLTAVLAICNSSLITGKVHYFFSWRFFGNIYLFLLAVTVLPKAVRENRKLWHALTALVVLATAGQNVFYAGLRYPWHGLSRGYAEAMAWLDANAAPEAVVAALSPEANAIIPIFTKLKVLVACGAPHISQLPARENALRLKQAARMLQADEKRLYQDMFDARVTGDHRIFIDRPALDMEHLLGYAFARYPADRIAQHLEQPLEKPFAVDYVWVGPLESRYQGAKFPLSKDWKLEPAFKNDEVRLYRVAR